MTLYICNVCNATLSAMFMNLAPIESDCTFTRHFICYVMHFMIWKVKPTNIVHFSYVVQCAFPKNNLLQNIVVFVGCWMVFVAVVNVWSFTEYLVSTILVPFCPSLYFILKALHTAHLLSIQHLFSNIINALLQYWLSFMFFSSWMFYAIFIIILFLKFMQEMLT